MEKFLNNAEIYAEKAENLRAFSGVKLLHIRNQVESILKLIGTSDIFYQYTKHDISHIDEMLRMLDWLIPKKTTDKLSKAEWLMIVLSIYFHDLGMVVTKDEYNNRGTSDFAIYQQSVKNNDKGIEYKEKVLLLGDEDEVEKFLYQEFIRENHATRIKNIILGDANNSLGNTSGLINEVNKLLENLDSAFRRDLAKICESHHKDDIDDFNTYKTYYSYGSTDDENVNLNYVAIILRTVDLLHFTSDRTPTTQYRLINPTDPKSILEWQKQMGVKAVKQKMKKNHDGIIDNALQPDTIEVTAYFDKAEKAEAYFGLTSYLLYVKNELKKSFDIVDKARKTQGTSNYEFPWLYLDDENVEVKGFEKRQLQFNLDQNSILQLLVGHTLYNDSSVVLRELVQNSLDAIELQKLIEDESSGKQETKTFGEVKIIWDSQKRELVFYDNGTGMTTFEIENYLLKVGASKYRTPEFQKKYQDFSAISHFGIGILTCFLVANDIDIVTNSTEENVANMISIRKLDGKYLLQKLEKNTLDNNIATHGTKVTLYIRHDVILDNLLDDLKKWILFPSSKVTLKIDNAEPIMVGYDSPYEALNSEVSKKRWQNAIEVKQKQIDGVDVAFLVEYSQYFKQYEFLKIESMNKDINQIVGTCINGIRIDDNSPGFDGRSIIAVANVVGKNSPKTNVARSAIEMVSRDYLLKNIYSIYISHVQEQLNHMQNEGYSLAWSVAETDYLIRPLVNGEGTNYSMGRDSNVKPLSEDILLSELGNIQGVILENDNKRSAVSPKKIIDLPEINIISGRMIDSAESLLKEITTSATLTSVINRLVDKDYLKINPETNILCNYSDNSLLHRIVLEQKEVSKIIVYPEDRRIDLKLISESGSWFKIDNSFTKNDIFNYDYNYNYNYERYSRIYNIPMKDISMEGIKDEAAVFVIGQMFLNPSHYITNYIIKHIDTYSKENEYLSVLRTILNILFSNRVMYSIRDIFNAESELGEYIKIAIEKEYHGREFCKKMIDIDGLSNLIFEKEYHIYDPNDWYRKS